MNQFAVAPDMGGGTRHVELAGELEKRGWRTCVVASDFSLHSRRFLRRPSEDYRHPIEEKWLGATLRWHWSAPYQRNNWKRLLNWISFSRSVFGLRKALPRYDVVIGSSPHLFAALAALAVARSWGSPFVLEVRDLWPESILAAGGRKGVAYAIFAGIARYLYRRADRIIVLARGSSERLVALGVNPGVIAYIPNGVDTAAIAPAGLTRRNGKQQFTVLYAGAHGPANGLDTVLDAATLLSDRPDIRILLVGDGPAKHGLKERARALGLQNVEFRDPVSKQQMPQLFSEADAGLMVLREAKLFAFGVSPNKLFDYLAAGLPVVCNVAGDVASMLEAARAGEQAVDSSARSLADAILILRERPEEQRTLMGKSGRAWVEREHARPVLAARLDSMLRDITEG